MGFYNLNESTKKTFDLTALLANFSEFCSDVPSDGQVEAAARGWEQNVLL